MRNFKLASLAIVALAAMSAMGVSAAQASTLEAGIENATIVGADIEGSENLIQIGSSSFSCEDSTFHGTMPAASSTLDLNLDYTECETSFGTNLTFDNNGCKYRFHGGNETAAHTFAGTLALVCPEGKDLTITSGLCTIHVTPVNGIPVTFTHKTNADPNKGDIELHINYNQVPLHVTNVFLCPISTSVTTGTLKETITFRAFREANQVDLTITK